MIGYLVALLIAKPQLLPKSGKQFQLKLMDGKSDWNRYWCVDDYLAHLCQLKLELFESFVDSCWIYEDHIRNFWGPIFDRTMMITDSAQLPLGRSSGQPGAMLYH
ncbi:hypothetical protein MA16_Dca023021 [Dendrobium catenatum]|uniref:Uncharacterized protein n=1 Tax=Dendrobium catenatum TaxID=906689 RepID=A0A2I0WJ47_9ASPA|nr:hypothetical protein MA16_Dca023021 [Dendrobium catenatum]